MVHDMNGHSVRIWIKRLASLSTAARSFLVFTFFSSGDNLYVYHATK